ncbi:N-6 DNA methylase [Candidatus Sumerlaeota bacterium]|nr:N-6 DNA methylase [Candidatus Sumerlaeota bacterium]
MPEKQPAGKQIAQGERILGNLVAILRRCKEAGIRLGYPGEGEERPFRGWLVSDLLTDVLGWPKDKVVVGERFDILLLDADGYPIATVETKRPYREASKKEREDFEERLSGFGTLRTAYFTNGAEWERLDIFCPTGALEVRERFNLCLHAATGEQAEAFFAPLVADRHFAEAPRSARHGVRKENPHILEALAADLDQAVGDLAFFFERLLSGFRERMAGQQTRAVTLELFKLWCEKSLVVSPHRAAEHLSEQFQKGTAGTEIVVSALAELGLTGPLAAAVAENLVGLSPTERCDAERLADALWGAYTAIARNFCAQTAHVLLARALLYRIGEDQGVFPRLLSGEQMEKALTLPKDPLLDAPKPATELLSRVQRSMQDFVPAIYRLGEFDWWMVMPDKRAGLKPDERTWLRGMDGEYERAAERLLRMLNAYFFGRVDVDVWRNVYQHYLPEDERQRLGGFYTPDELVNLVLDLAEFHPSSECLCSLSFIDPACGSGAFVTAALARLLEHLALDMPCHAELHQRGLPEWKRAEAMLNTVAKNLHAVDIHPFASFLTTLNVLFLIMPLYAKAREKNPDFSLDLQVFSSDSLEKHDDEILSPDLFATLNSRVQLTADSFHRYQAMLKKRFDRVFGNPPWGGVLKGPLAPVYDTAKKQRFALEYPAAAQGKYDVYGLFMERALQILKPKGRLGLLTQGSFIDKEWAAGLRRFLASKTRLRFIVDLNPFGQLFFRRMNIPCITVADALPDGDGRGECTAILSAPPDSFKGQDEKERRKQVAATVREVVQKVSVRRKAVAVGFAHASRVSLAHLRKTAHNRWDLAPTPKIEATQKGWLTADRVLEMRQGVTPGGCLDVFLMSEDKAKQLGFEEELVYRAIKSKEVGRWSVSWSGRILLYPYRVVKGIAVPAFALDLRTIRDRDLAEILRQSRLSDALDFTKQIDRREEEIVRRKGVNRLTVPDLLRHRVALSLVRYPIVAAYLIGNYERLEGRIFKQRSIRDFNRRWYECLWPRDPDFVLSKKRIVSPTLMKHVRFSLDKMGFLSDHACLFLRPSRKTAVGYSSIRGQLAAAIGRRVFLDDVLKYCLAFLNSDYAQQRLTTGHRPTPKGFYAVTEEFLREIPIPPPKKRAAPRILDLVAQLIAAKDDEKVTHLERELANIVNAILKA